MMLLSQAVDEFIETLRPLYIDETKFYDTFPGNRQSDPPVEILNVHSVRLFASIAGIGIKEGSTKVLEEPDLSDPNSEVIISAYAIWLHDSHLLAERLEETGRGAYAEITQKTHRFPKGGGDPYINPNYRETGFSRAQRNAMLGLIPARYVIQRIKQLTIEKNEVRSMAEKVSKARASAQGKARIVEGYGIASIDTLEKVKSIRGDNIEEWNVTDWNYLESELDLVISNHTPSESTESEGLDEEVDSLPEEEISSEELTAEEASEEQGEF